MRVVSVACVNTHMHAGVQTYQLCSHSSGGGRVCCQENEMRKTSYATSSEGKGLAFVCTPLRGAAEAGDGVQANVDAAGAGVFDCVLILAMAAVRLS